MLILSRIEGHFVRSSLAVAWLAVCLGMAGCKLFDGRKPAGSASSGGSPFMGSPSSTGTNSAATADATEGRGGGGVVTPVGASSALPADVNGVLAGYVNGNFNPNASKIYVQIIDPSDSPSSARLLKRIRTNSFNLQGLKAGREYRLVVIVKEGERQLSGEARATPPNPRVNIKVSEGPLPAGISLPNTTATLPGGGPEQARPTSAPVATLDPPVRTVPTGPAPGPAPLTTPTAPPAGGSNLIGGLGRPKNGFTEVPPTVSVPGRNVPPIPEGPRYPPTPDERPLPPLTVPKAVGPPSAVMPPLSARSSDAPVPSCAIIGRRVDNFALYGLDGQPWELRRHRHGRLVLLDFWYSTCGPCLSAMGHLRELQQKYGSYGLQVVGVAYEKGSAEEQVRKVRAVRARYGINYTTLLGGGGTEACPVKTQFRIAAFPTLVLIDETGLVVWRSEGLDEQKLYQLQLEVHRRLGLPMR